ncbi:hypothetical protein K438DRAFT_2012479 [Mycena galopus ATCC 62051]|nr:hypothetical protein K438DRAFT_2012479 [Mycena galopus ATCC 62051]
MLAQGSTPATYYPSSEPRKEDAVDVCIVGERLRRPKRRHSPFKFETGNEVIPIPHPPQMHNKVNYITSPSSVVAWLGDIREEMGVEVYSATQSLFSPPSPTRKTRRAGRGRASVPRAGHPPHASLSKHEVAMYDLRHEKEAQMYGIGVKEAWCVEEKHVAGPRFGSRLQEPVHRLEEGVSAHET